MTVTNPRGKTMTSTYDALGNVLTERDPLNRTTTRTYDLLGRLTSSTDPRGITVTSGYDAAGRVTAITYPGGGITYTYDAAGQRTGMTDASGTTTWTFDAAGRTTAVAAPQGTVGYAYNAAGERSSMSLPGSRMVTYTYDATSGRLSSLTDWAARTTSFGYDSEGRRSTVTRPNGVVSTTSHDAAGRRTAISHTKNGVTVQSFTASYDAAGNRTSVTGAAGAETYTYDALGRITAVTYPAGGGSASYTYDAHGNRLTLTQGGTTTTYTYDDADQLVSDGTNSFVYDAAGNLTTAGSQTYTWDWNSRMTSATVSGTTTSYTYDGDDVRTQRTQGSTTSFLWDRESGLPLLVDDGSFGYVYAGETPLDQISAGGTAASLLLDPLGSVRGLADASGALSGSRDYDVYGALRSSSGTYGRLGFTGEQMDAETGFVFLRARYHDPVTGRFVSRDTVQPNAPGSQGYHIYAYAANNPTTWTDPSGHFVTALSMTHIMALGMLGLAVYTWARVNDMQEMGAIELCAADSICGRVLESATATLDNAFNHTDAATRRFLESLYRTFPIAMYAIYWQVGAVVVAAIAACVASGGCIPRRSSCPTRRIVPAILPWVISRQGRSGGMFHIMRLHGRSSPDRRGTPGFWGNYDGKWDSNNPIEVAWHIEQAIWEAQSSGRSWSYRPGPGTCTINGRAPSNVGWDNPATLRPPYRPGNPTSCVTIAVAPVAPIRGISAVSPWAVYTAFPTRNSQC